MLSLFVPMAIWFAPSLAAILSLRWLPGNRADAEAVA